MNQLCVSEVKIELNQADSTQELSNAEFNTGIIYNHSFLLGFT